MFRFIKFRGRYIGLEPKSVQKSVRMRASVYEYVMSFPGKNFSEKLENLIIEYGNHNPDYVIQNCCSKNVIQ